MSPCRPSSASPLPIQALLRHVSRLKGPSSPQTLGSRPSPLCASAPTCGPLPPSERVWGLPRAQPTRLDRPCLPKLACRRLAVAALQHQVDVRPLLRPCRQSKA